MVPTASTVAMPNGIITFQKGIPLQISNGGNNTKVNSNGQRPNNNGHSGIIEGNIADRVNAQGLIQYLKPLVVE